MRISTAHTSPDRGAPSVVLVAVLLGAETHCRADVMAAVAPQ
jgi:hypothetical protein